MGKYTKIKICADSGEADLTLTDAFKAESVIWQADILSDIMHDAIRLYEESRKQMTEAYGG